MGKLEGQPAFKSGTTHYLIEALDKVSVRDLTILEVKGDRDSLLMADFENAERDVTFLVNAGYTDTVVKVAYTDGYAGKATLYHPDTGYIETVTPGAGMEITVPACVGLILVREAENGRDDTPYIPHESTSPDGESTHTPDSSPAATEPVSKGGCRSAVSAWGILTVAAACAVALKAKK